MFVKRLFSTIILLPLLSIIILWAPAPIFLLLIVFVSVSATLEFFEIIYKKGIKSFREFALAVSFALPFLTFLSLPSSSLTGLTSPYWALFSSYLLSIGILLPLIIGFLSSLQIVRGDPAGLLENVSSTLLGIAYIGLPLSASIPMREMHEGRILLFVLLVVKLGDVGAYLSGKHFGGRNLAPLISPNKTISGAIGGLGACLVSGSLFGLFLLPGDFGVVSTLCLSGILGVIGQMGDLIESSFKRDAGVKDSGEMIPGIGGILDGIDSLIFAIPVAYIWMQCSDICQVAATS